MPPGIYEIFLKGLRVGNKRQLQFPIPNPAVSCRPDEIKKSLQSEYGQKVRSLVFELLREPGLIRDGGTGSSLVDNPVPLCCEAYGNQYHEMMLEQDDTDVPEITNFGIIRNYCTRLSSPL